MTCCTVIGFPNGTHRPTVKAIEATAAVKEGATEIDVVAFLPFLVNCDVDSAKRELTEIALERLSNVPDLSVYGPDNAEDRAGVISMTLGEIHPHD